MSGGFDAYVGNPPWVSYAGRAAQPIAEHLKGFYLDTYAAFAGYRNLQGMFVERCGKSLRVGGRLGLVIPSSMSEQSGYEPTRVAHDRYCACERDLPDIGEEAFAGVFQPCMVLHSTRRAKPIQPAREPWPVKRDDLDADAITLLAKFDRPSLPKELFGERGLQSSGVDVEHFAASPDERHTIPFRVGGDIAPFRRGEPSLFADASWFGERIRPTEEWRAIRVLIRQTARVPMAALSDGAAFRNSILAGFTTKEYPAEFLVAYLNSNPIRWLHYMRNRDARQGMPQMKIGHLRALPAPGAEVVGTLTKLGASISTRNDGATHAEQSALDEIVGRSFGLSKDELAGVANWARSL